MGAVGNLVQKWGRDSTKGETIHTTIQKHRIHKIENKNTIQKANIKRIFKTRKSNN